MLKIMKYKSTNTTLIFGTSNSGKTRVLFNKAIEMSSNKNNVIFITFEESKHTLNKRFGHHPNINIIECDYLTIDDLDDILHEYSGNCLFIDDLSRMDVRNNNNINLMTRLDNMSKEYNIEIFVSLNTNK